jgi:23S rRNA pseudouridine2605 synthase
MVDHNYDPTLPAARGQDEAASSGDGERVAKALARAGVASRREVERLIEAGRVSLNGRVLDTPAVKVTPGDVLAVDGKPVGAAQPARVWRYHKPVGLVTTHKDPKGRPTVFAHLPPGLPRVISVGRLDLNSEGLLLLTNDGTLARALELPNNGVTRRYRARARGQATQAKLDTLKDGLTVEGVRYGPIEAKLDKAREAGEGPANLWITVTLNEGKNREVRKVLEALGLTVNRLIRLSYGPFQLGTLASGAVEEVGPRVIREQLGEYIAPENLPTGSQTAATPQPAAPSRRAAPGDLKANGESRKTEYKPGWARPAKRPARGPSKKARPPKGDAAARGAKPDKPRRPKPR